MEKTLCYIVGLFTVDNPNANAAEPVAIEYFLPTTDPVVLSDSLKETFVVTVNAGAGSDITYRYLLDDVLLAENSRSFYELFGNTMSAGMHSFKVVATNAINSTEKIFNVRKILLRLLRQLRLLQRVLR